MFDPTPSPFGDITRRFTHLTCHDRAGHTDRLLGAVCHEPCSDHVDQPGLDGGVCYRQLVVAVRAGDPVALGWLATTHRPLLLARGAALFEHDPSEWGAVCLEGLHVTVARIDLSIGRWVRRRVAHHLSRHVSRAAARHLQHRRREQPTAPELLHQARAASTGARFDPDLELSIVLDGLLAGLDPATRDGFLALANEQPIEAVADRHHLSQAAVRQRMSRARRQLQPQLADYRRMVDA